MGFCITATSDVAPPGGWMHPDNRITNIARQTDRLHRTAKSSDTAVLKYRTQTPTMLDRKCPKIRFFGWDAGA